MESEQISYAQALGRVEGLSILLYQLGKVAARVENFTKKALKVITSIPHGKVMTYGQIARVCGQPRGARQIVRILHSMGEKYELPWHRVINSKGEIGKRASEMVSIQKDLLESEGIIFTAPHQIDLEKYIVNDL